MSQDRADRVDNVGSRSPRIMSCDVEGPPVGDKSKLLAWLGQYSGSAIWLTYAVLASFIVIGNLGTPTSWNLTQWWYSYDLGFVKRGLLGTLLKPLSAHLGHVLAANVASLAILVLASLAIVTAATMFTVHQNRSVTSLLLSNAFITMPGSIAALSYDFGRFDGVLVVIVIWSTWATRRLIERPGHILGTALVLVQILGVLVHEIHLFVAAPVIVAVTLIRWRDAGAYARALVAATLLLTTLATWFVGVLGRVTTIDPDVLRRMAAAELPFPPSDGAVLVLTSSLSDSLAFTLERWSSPDGIAALASTAVGLIPLAIVMAVLLGPLALVQRTGVLLAASGPLALTLLGVDIGRWATFASLNAVLAIMVVLDSTPEPDDGLPLSSSKTAVLAYAILLGASLGGFAVSRGIPRLTSLISDGLQRLSSF